MNNEISKYEATTAPARQQNVSSEIAQSREMAEVQAAIIMARRFPRDEMRSIEKIRNACSRPGLADAAIYQYSRGGTDVTGPSIRLAEAIAQSWGNVQYGVRELEQVNQESTCEAFAWDVENNVRVAKSFKVSHIRHTKRGDYVLTDPRDIYEMVANNGARRVRSCILGVIPGDVVDIAVEQCELTLQTTAEVTPETIKKMKAAFAKYGVTPTQIEARIQRRLDALTPAQLVMLRKIIASLQDGMSRPEDWFEAATDAQDASAEDGKDGKAKTLKGALKAKQPKDDAKQNEAAEPELVEQAPDEADLLDESDIPY